jgi:hypothetical protein
MHHSPRLGVCRIALCLAPIALACVPLSGRAEAQSPRPALEVRLSSPAGVAVDAEGRALIVDTANRKLRRLEPDGTLATVVGDGVAESPTGRLVRPTSAATMPDGGIVIADPGAQRVWWAPPGGPIVPLAGNGKAGFSGDGGPASLAQLNNPVAVAVVAGTAVVIADRDNNRIRRVGADGVITTVAGGPTPERPRFRASGTPADTAPTLDRAGPARLMALSKPSGVAATPDGGFVVADTGNAAIRRYFFGVMTVIAGMGHPGPTEEGVPARRSELAAPVGLAITDEGDVLFADQHSQRIRRVARNGQLETVAGNGEVGNAEQPLPATIAPLAWPTGVAALPSGEFLVADTGAHQARKVDRDGVLQTIAGTQQDVSLALTIQRTFNNHTAYLRRDPLTVRRGCRLNAPYWTSKSGTGHVHRAGKANPSLGDKRVERLKGKFKGRRVRWRARERAYTIWFWVTWKNGGTSGSDHQLRVRPRGVCR